MARGIDREGGGEGNYYLCARRRDVEEWEFKAELCWSDSLFWNRKARWFGKWLLDDVEGTSQMEIMGAALSLFDVTPDFPTADRELYVCGPLFR